MAGVIAVLTLAGTSEQDDTHTVTAAGPAGSATTHIDRTSDRERSTDGPTSTTTPAATTTAATTATTAIASTTTTAPATTTTVALLRVVDVIDGDTIDLSDGSRVRLIGIDTPERGDCGYREATEALQSMLGDGYVAIVPGARDDVDRYGRLLRYVEVGSVDVGLELIRSGRAIARYDSRDGYGHHDRERSYIAADAATPSANGCAAAAPAPPPTTAPRAAPSPAPPAPQGSGCDPNYDPCVPIDSDVDCASGRGNGPSYVRVPVRVVGSDVYDLDGNGDGVGCE